jgi:plastin-1
MIARTISRVCKDDQLL